VGGPCALAVALYTKSLNESAPKSPSAALALGRAVQVDPGFSQLTLHVLSTLETEI